MRVIRQYVMSGRGLLGKSPVENKLAIWRRRHYCIYQPGTSPLLGAIYERRKSLRARSLFTCLSYSWVLSIVTIVIRVQKRASHREQTGHSDVHFIGGVT